MNNTPTYVDPPTNPYELWFNTLRGIEDKYQVGIDLSNVYSEPATLGNFPAKSMIKWAKESREKIKSHEND